MLGAGCDQDAEGGRKLAIIIGEMFQQQTPLVDRATFIECVDDDKYRPNEANVCIPERLKDQLFPLVGDVVLIFEVALMAENVGKRTSEVMIPFRQIARDRADYGVQWTLRLDAAVEAEEGA